MKINKSKANPKVAIVLSTYNGAVHLCEQIDSLLAQSAKNITIHVRDDGSTDATRSILERYKFHHDNIHLHFGTNIGVCESFLEALNLAGPNYDYYCFCDQDDVWLPEKIERALDQLSSSSESSVLYFSRQILVDADLREIGLSREMNSVGFDYAVFANAAVGCTVVFDNLARDIVLGGRGRDVKCHDWWAYLAISAIGEVVYDEAAYIRYRQHASNVVGAQRTFSSLLKRKTGELCGKFPVVSPRHLLNCLLDVHGDRLPNDRKAYISFILEKMNGHFFSRLLAFPELARSFRSTRNAVFLFLQFCIFGLR